MTDALVIDAPVIDLTFTGDYALACSVAQARRAAFVGGMGPSAERDALDLAFPLEGSWSAVGVRVSQDGAGARARVLANPGGAATSAICDRLRRMLSLDVDGAAFKPVAARDPVIEALRRRRPGLRPILFPSPYETAARAIIGHQLAVPQAAAIARRLGEAHGARLDMGDRILHAFPAPAALADLPPAIPGLAARKVEQLRALGQAADVLGTDRLRAMTPEAAREHVQQLSGIGPFSAELILIRGVGNADAFARTEPSLHQAMLAAYGLGPHPDASHLDGSRTGASHVDAARLDALEAIAEGWRPYRSWAGLLLRASLPPRR